jgi:hypothetical protein
MRVHLDLLGWLYVAWGATGVLAGAALGVMAVGTMAALDNLGAGGSRVPPTVWLLLIGAGLFAGAGGVMALAGRALVRRARVGRHAALTLAVANLIVIPFGTALSVYTFWALLNDEARLEFGRPARGTGGPGAPFSPPL